MHVTRFFAARFLLYPPRPHSYPSLLSFMLARELKKARQLQREQRRLKNDFTFYASRHTHKSFTLFITVTTIAKLNPEHGGKFQIKS